MLLLPVRVDSLGVTHTSAVSHRWSVALGVGMTSLLPFAGFASRYSGRITSVLIFNVLFILIIVGMSVLMLLVLFFILGLLVNHKLVMIPTSGSLNISEVSSAHVTSFVLKWLINHANDKPNNLNACQRHNYECEISDFFPLVVLLDEALHVNADHYEE